MSAWVFYISEFVFDFVKVLMAFRLVEAASTPRRSEKVERCAVWATGVVIACLTIYNIFLSDVVFSNFLMMLCAIMLVLVIFVLRKIKFLDALSIVYLFWVMIHIFDFFTQTLMHRVFSLCGGSSGIFREVSIERGLYLLCLTAGVIALGRRLLAEKAMFCNIKYKTLLEIVLIPVMTVLMAYFQRIYIDLLADDYMSNWMLFWLAYIITFVGCVSYAQKIRVMEANNNMQVKLNLLETNYEQATRRYQEKAELLHDEKHHVDAIREMLEKRKVEDALQYVNEVSKRISRSGNRIWSKHQFLDLVLNMKQQEAEERLIDLEIFFDDMSELTMQETDISVLFGNLLDNAIEATEKIFDPDERWIKIFGERKGELLLLNMSNSTGQALQYEGSQLVTTKADKALHGFGMQSIRHVVEKYQGEMEIMEKDGSFHIVLMLEGFNEYRIRTKKRLFEDK